MVNYLNEGQELIKKNRAEVQRLSEETARNREVVRRLATQ
ncbi:unnamed protein product [Protopolystoma xenopodis]|uniref:Uncharacterized protein n=1 Tax=Protopolystoma xenopodis TaxID=117903 RepID=A0A3S5FCL7_9PLAT|nr:unnamed protein product [Protopolystoma xenopodis]